MKENLILIAYLISSVMFIVAIKRLGKVNTARQGNMLSAIAMLIAIVATLVKLETFDPKFIILGVLIGTIIGVISALKVAMTSMPEMVAIFNGFGGAASAMVAIAEFMKRSNSDPVNSTIIMIAIIIGTITFTGSFVAYGKLKGFISGQPITFWKQNLFNGLVLILLFVITYLAVTTTTTPLYFYFIIGIGLLLGILSVIPIGGADMPVVISLLNSYSGIAAAMAGFVLGNHVLIVSGALVGASGIFLTNIMCRGMNRSLSNVLFSAFGKVDETVTQSATKSGITVKEMSPENAAFTMQSAETVIIVPGYGMAVAQAQHEVRKLADELEKNGVDVKFAVHPVA
ncbi:MAG: NAD(P)(+) transhydrogenase (Re/Si-specific) subunit beta, partial [Methylococcales bacterium]|nr:NAD(P)(+) transhydrogenase (Re/Si-specific) subunit beta [Methylococcales bacterium]